MLREAATVGVASIAAGAYYLTRNRGVKSPQPQAWLNKNLPNVPQFMKPKKKKRFFSLF